MRLLPASLLFPISASTLLTGATLFTAAHERHTPAAAPAQSGEPRSSAALGDGTIHTFVTLDSAGRPSAVGATFTAGVLRNLPDTLTPLTLGLGSAVSRTPFTHLYVDWVPHGHAPGGIYDRPHIDFHFFLASLQERLAVAGGVDSLPPPRAMLPLGYAKVTESVAFMGTHFGDTSGAEFHGVPFDKVVLYGSHEGKITFYDFMVTTAWLATEPNTVIRIKQPASYPAAGYYPTQVRVTYDSTKASYRVALERFVSH